jgi:tetratricopeptide (TPR) repeat protein
MPQHDTGKDLGPTPAMSRAIELLQKGDTVQAEEVLLEAIQDVEDQVGPDTPEAATAHNDLGTLWVYLGQHRKAVDTFRRACAVDIRDDIQATRDRLSYLLNLGKTLEHLGELDEAEKVLRQGLKRRQGFYGREHPGYAFGLEPLAELLLRRGKPGEAELAINEVVTNLWNNAHPRIAAALALRARILHTNQSPRQPYADLDALPNPIIEDLAQHVFQQVDAEQPTAVDRKVLHDLLELLTRRLGEEHAAALNTLTLLANLERSLGDTAARAVAIRRVIGILDRKKDLEKALHAVLGLALAQSEAGAVDDAAKTYAEAQTRAAALAQPALQSQVLRNYGLFLADHARRAEAEPLLRQAVTFAEKAGDPEMLGRAQVALGVFLQHGQQLEPARPLLAAALRTLDPAHLDAICARSHLAALEAGGACGCGDLRQASAQALREFILARVPLDLLGQLDVDDAPDGWKIQVQLQREPVEDELEQLNRVITHAVEEFRRRAQQVQ